MISINLDEINKNNKEQWMSGTRDTGLMTVVWREKARQPVFWQEVTAHGKATRKKPLFKDDNMTLFIDAAAIEHAKKLDPKLALAIAVRYKFFTGEISKTIKVNQTKQVVLLGGGYDTRAVRKKKYSDVFGVKFFEVDQQEVLTKKLEIYQKNKICPNAIYIGMDYIKEDLISHLQKSGLDFNVATHFVWEGNTFYLTPLQIEDTLKQIKQAFTAKVYISFDYMQRGLADVPEVCDLKLKLAHADAAMKSDIVDFRLEITEKLGFTIVNHQACSAVTKDYGVGDHPYKSQENYYLCTLK